MKTESLSSTLVGLVKAFIDVQMKYDKHMFIRDGLYDKEREELVFEFQGSRRIVVSYCSDLRYRYIYNLNQKVGDIPTDINIKDDVREILARYHHDQIYEMINHIEDTINRWHDNIMLYESICKFVTNSVSGKV